LHLHRSEELSVLKRGKRGWPLAEKPDREQETKIFLQIFGKIEYDDSLAIQGTGETDPRKKFT
jgi:hypothetical protein